MKLTELMPPKKDSDMRFYERDQEILGVCCSEDDDESQTLICAIVPMHKPMLHIPRFSMYICMEEPL